jgi:hypothetical protein
LSDEELTRKQWRDHSRAECKAAEEAIVMDAARRKKLAQLGVAVALVVLSVVAVLVVRAGAKLGSMVASPRTTFRDWPSRSRAWTSPSG